MRLFEQNPNSRCFLIAEIGQAHDGSLGMAHSFIDLVADLGVDAIKFQTHLAQEESTRDEVFRIPFSYEDESRYDYWSRMEFSKEQWHGLITHAKKRGLAFGTSCFSLAAVDMLQEFNIDFWKVGSGEIHFSQMIEKMATTRLPVLLSSGLATHEDLINAVEIVRSHATPVGIFQCTSKYPTKFSEIGLNRISELRRDFRCPIGLSDHSGEIWPSIAAVAQGAEMIEFHLAFHKSQFGPDTGASLIPDQVRQLVDGRDAMAIMFDNPIEKDQWTDAQREMRKLFGRSLALSRHMKAGEIITKEDLALKKPASGISVNDLGKVVGRRLLNDKSPERLLIWKDLD